jgi:hypothetical protein
MHKKYYSQNGEDKFLDSFSCSEYNILTTISYNTIWKRK